MVGNPFRNHNPSPKKGEYDVVNAWERAFIQQARAVYPGDLDDYMTTIAGFKVSELVGMVWTPRHHFVNVVINGAYRGPYLLCESVKRNPDCRLNVDKWCGFIFECDPYWWNEDVYVTSDRHPSYNYTFKYPDSEDITQEQLDYMQTLVKAYEASLKSTNYPDFIDVR
jgi:hypothetical protein